MFFASFVHHTAKRAYSFLQYVSPWRCYFLNASGLIPSRLIFTFSYPCFCFAGFCYLIYLMLLRYVYVQDVYLPPDMLNLLSDTHALPQPHITVAAVSGA